MKHTTLAAVPLALTILAVTSCRKDSTGPASTLGAITCSTSDAAVCPPASLTPGFNGSSGTPTIAPRDAGTTISRDTSAYAIFGTTSSATNGYWFLITGGTLRAWGIITVAGGSYAAEIPLFCGRQALVYRFDNASGHSYWYANATLSNCQTATFRAQLTWDTGPQSSDLDLHLVRPAGSTNTANDCYFLDCVPPDALDWGPAGATGNPVLDVDNTNGYGPENITLSNPDSGSYRVIVQNYNGVANTHATVKLYFDDVEVYRNTSVVMDSTHDYWTVASVNVANKTFTVVDTYSATAPAAPGARPIERPARR